MWDFIQAGGPIMFFLLLVSVVAVTFIIERGLALRWSKVIPPNVEEAVARCRTAKDSATVMRAAEAHSSPLSRLLLVANEHLNGPKQENVDSVETRARHEVMNLDRG